LGFRYEIPVAQGAIPLAHILEALFQLFSGEHISRAHAEEGGDQNLRVAEQLDAYEIDGVQMVKPAFFDVHADVGEDAQVIRLEEREPPSVTADLHDFDGGIEYLGLEVALVVIRFPQFLHVVIELVRVEGFGEDVFEEDGVRETVRMRLLHLPGDPAFAEGVIAGNVDFADFDLRALIDYESQGQRSRGHLLDLRI